MAMSGYPQCLPKFDIANGESSSSGPCADGVPLPSWTSKPAQVHSVDVLPSYKSALSMSLSSLPELEPYNADRHSRSLDELPSMHTPSSQWQRERHVDVYPKMRATNFPGQWDDYLDDVPSRVSPYAERLLPPKRSHVPTASIWTRPTATTLDEMPYTCTMDTLPESEAWTPMGTMEELPPFDMGPPSRFYEGRGFEEAHDQPQWRHQQHVCYQQPSRVHQQGRDVPWEMDVTKVRVTPPAAQRHLLENVLHEQLMLEKGGLPRNPAVDYGLYVFGMLDKHP